MSGGWTLKIVVVFLVLTLWYLVTHIPKRGHTVSDTQSQKTNSLTYWYIQYPQFSICPAPTCLKATSPFSKLTAKEKTSPQKSELQLPL